MKSAEYKSIIKRIVCTQLRKKESDIKSADVIATAVYARLYGACVEGVDSPLWREVEPTETAQEILDKSNPKENV